MTSASMIGNTSSVLDSPLVSKGDCWSKNISEQNLRESNKNKYKLCRRVEDLTMKGWYVFSNVIVYSLLSKN